MTVRSALEKFVDRKLQDSWVAFPGIVLSVDRQNLTLEVAPKFFFTKEKFTDGLSPPVLVDVPIAFPRGGNSIIMPAIKENDVITILATQVSVQSLLQNRDTVDIDHRPKMRMAGAIAVPGLTLAEEMGNTIVGTDKFTIPTTGMKILSDEQLRMVAPEIEMVSDENVGVRITQDAEGIDMETAGPITAKGSMFDFLLTAIKDVKHRTADPIVPDMTDGEVNTGFVDPTAKVYFKKGNTIYVFEHDSIITTTVGLNQVSANFTVVGDDSNDLSSNFTVLTAADFAELSANFTVQQQAFGELSANVTVSVLAASAELSSNFTITGAASDQLSANFTVTGIASDELSASFSIQRAASVELSANLTVVNADSSQLSANLTVQTGASAQLSANFNLGGFTPASRELSSNFYIPLDISNILDYDGPLQVPALLSANFTVPGGSVELSANFTMAFLSSDELSANMTVVNSASQELSANFTAQLPSASAELSSNLTVVGAASVELSANMSVTLASASVELSANLTVGVPTTVFGMEIVIPPPLAAEISANFTIGGTDSAQLSANLTVVGSASDELSANITIQQSGSSELSSNLLVGESGQSELSANLTVQSAASSELSSNLTVQAAASSELSSNLTIGETGLAELSANLTVQQSASSELSSNVTIGETGFSELSANLTIGGLFDSEQLSANFQVYSEAFVYELVTLFVGGSDLSANFYVNYETADLSANFTVVNSDSDEMSANFTMGV